MASTVDSKRVKEFVESPEVLEAKLDELADLMRASAYTVFYTGAGMSTSAGVSDYRGPSGAWTLRKINELEARGTGLGAAERAELAGLLREKAKETRKASIKVDLLDAQPTAAHMAQATLLRRGLAHYVVTTNLDGLYRKAGLAGRGELCCLHGDVYIERCTGCGHDFERNYEVRQAKLLHVHDHRVGGSAAGAGAATCARCGSAPKTTRLGKLSRTATTAQGRGTKDTHINFGENLDPRDWDDAEAHCSRADLCIVAGSSMSLRHITHMPFLAKRVVICNLQATPDDAQCDLRLWADLETVHAGLLRRLGVESDPVPVWRPKDAVPLASLPRWLLPRFVEKARNLEAATAALEAVHRARRASEGRAGLASPGDDTECDTGPAAAGTAAARAVPGSCGATEGLTVAMALAQITS